MRRRSVLGSLGAATVSAFGGAAGLASASRETVAVPDRRRGERGRGPPGGHGPEAGPLTVRQTSDGPFLVDQYGRTVILHGVNVGRKTPPFVPTPAEFDATDVRRIRSWGFNAVRLGVIWEGIMPARGVVDDAYLDRVRELVALFDRHDLHVFVDAHQDLYSREFHGDGAPAWAVYTDGVPYRKSDPWQLDYADPAVARAFDNFWLDNHGLQAAFTDALQAVARRVGDVDGVVGYEPFNEPSPGMATAAGFSEHYLPQFYERVAAGLREVDDAPIWVEPEGLTNAGKPATLGEVAVDDLVYSFHNYADLPLDFANPQAGDRTDAVGYRNQEWVVANNRQRAEAIGAAPVLTEFSPGNDLADLRHLLRLADAYRLGWTYWAYANWGTRTSGEAGTLTGHPDVVDTVVRPYPPAIAGVPESYGFDPATGRFTLTYRPWTTATRPTVLFVPARRYPDGAAIDVEGGHVTRTTGAYVRIRHRHGRSRVSVTVAPPD